MVDALVLPALGSTALEGSRETLLDDEREHSEQGYGEWEYRGHDSVVSACYLAYDVEGPRLSARCAVRSVDSGGGC